MLQFLPASTASFTKIREGNLLYVDKTEYVYQLGRQPAGAYFLSRPRRFGKSLFVSTLEQLFLGNRDLFKGLWIDSSDYEWQTYPVIRIDFSRHPIRTVSDWEKSIRQHFKRICRTYQVTVEADSPAIMFEELIFELSEKFDGQRVVILIDEYDKPIIDHIEKPEDAEPILDELKGFYGVIKSMEDYIRLAFITGISKFTRVSIFSELNNLTELTLRPSFSTAFGLTESEIRDYLTEHIADFARKEQISDEALLEQIRFWYDGFRFTREADNVYNPFSTMQLFDAKQFSNYWFKSGTPTFLIKLIHKRLFDVRDLNNLEIEELAFDSYDIANLALPPLLYQTGYLTIKDYDEENQTYILGYPNYEVENAFTTHLLDMFSNLHQGFSKGYIWKMIDALKEHDLDRFFKELQVLFANIDYDLQLNYEKYYQTIFYLTFKLIGLSIHAEVKTNDGRIDAVIELTDRIYLFEFKLDRSAEEALKQIEDQVYYRKYQSHDKPITCIGANFNTDSRMIDEWKDKNIDN